MPDLTHTRPDWDEYFLAIATAVSARADCRRRQVGAVIVDVNHRIIATGYNGVPAGSPGCLAGACPRGLLTYEQLAEHTDYDKGPGRCLSTHAEMNAIIYAGHQVRGCTIYVTDAPCHGCAKHLASAGIARVVVVGVGEVPSWVAA